ncbi:SCP2 sterol-binding domain-containing protein [Alkalibacillus haloalkaliphilus]|uniref:SCP2 sterol-binding domain-containing protein n=1 Tax=Alkalibacillus haloalkaliphilus TaxID=94136 RepID=UPI0029356D33|nr:SCP2 sterol-binding domain-containing protein [Alkalibacillus haloalkaliphilus]MDV2580764.1 SCP2 sterol-binding domain-containing protein [Alkalibacillus haloalkaliphilus]
MAIEEKLKTLVTKMNEDSSGLNGLQATYSFDITDEDHLEWGVKVSPEQVELSESLLEDADCLLRMNASNFEKLLDGSLNATSAFMMGKIKAKGDLTYALKLQNVLNNYR